MIIKRGYRGKISDFADPDRVITVRLSTSGNGVYDTCCFGLDAQDKLSDERYTVFYNQTSSPEGAVVYSQNGGYSDYSLMLGSLPLSVAKLVFTVSIDGAGTMGEIASHSVEILCNGTAAASLELSGSDFKNEKAIIDLEIYRKDQWRISAVARGFDGGLDAVLRSYGGVISEDSTSQTQAPLPAPAVPSPASPAPSPAVSEDKVIADRLMSRISLSKDKINLEKHVISLSKCVADLSCRGGIDLGGIRARVAVVLDYSGSMTSLYSNGTVQRTIHRLVPLGLTFDDNGSIDLYLFQNDYRKLPDLDLSNYENYVAEVIKRSGYSMGGTNYAPVLRAIINGEPQKPGGFFRFGHSGGTEALVNDYCPTFILFITDGTNSDAGETDCVIRMSSGMNVFIQFIGIGSDRFSYLMKLDDLEGRVRDNTGFTKMADLDNVSDDVLYMNILEQFSNWLKGFQ